MVINWLTREKHYKTTVSHINDTYTSNPHWFIRTATKPRPFCFFSTFAPWNFVDVHVEMHRNRKFSFRRIYFQVFWFDLWHVSHRVRKQFSKRNWMGSIEKFLPHRNVVVITHRCFYIVLVSRSLSGKIFYYFVPFVVLNT